MPTSPKTTIPGQLSNAQLVINNTLADTAIQELVAARGYSATEMAAGQALCETAIEAVDAQAAAAGAQRLATEHARAAEQQAREVYQGLAQTVRAIFPPNSPQRKTLELTGPTPTETTAFLAAATTLFNNALAIPEIATVLTKYGYGATTLRKERDDILAFQRAVEAQTLAKSNAQRATSLQVEALAALQRWVSQYLKIAKIALRKEPDLLKALIMPTVRGKSVQQPQAQTQATVPANP